MMLKRLDVWNLLSVQVLYNILDWPTKPHSKLVVIGINLQICSFYPISRLFVSFVLCFDVSIPRDIKHYGSSGEVTPTDIKPNGDSETMFWPLQLSTVARNHIKSS